jgi:hypothetical protein
MWRWLFILVLVAGIIWDLLPIPKPAYPPNGSGPVPAASPAGAWPEEPLQTMLSPGEVAPWREGGATITPLARYAIKARVLHAEPDYFGRPTTWSPVDLAVGWDAMADPAVYDQLHIQQHDRWYFYHWYGSPPLGRDQIIGESANTHILPANAEIQQRVMTFRAGEMVELSGYLVRVDCPDGWHWISSLSRTDTGDGSCEVMWVDTAQKAGR